MVCAGADRLVTCSEPDAWVASSLTIPWLRPIVPAPAWAFRLPVTALGSVRATVAPLTGMLAPLGALGPVGLAVTWTTNGASCGGGASVVVLHSSAPPPVPAEAGETESASSAGVVTDSAASAATVLLCRRCM